jgi:SAM-dependent methyltransferase
MDDCCITCGSNQLNKVRPYRTKTPHGKQLFAGQWLCECGECGLVQTVPAPCLQALSDYYAVDYRAGCCAGCDVSDSDRFPKDNLFYYNRGQSIADLVKPHVKTDRPRILDIGAGWGHILYAMGERFPEGNRTAIEFSQVCVRHLQGMGIEVYTDAAENVLPKLDHQFDVVTISHVFEHLLNPVEILKLVRQHLAPDGVLYIEVPNIPAESLLKYPDHLWAPRFDEPHITFFSIDVLRDSLVKAGFDPFFCDSAGPEYKYISGWRFKMPSMRWLAQELMPRPLFNFLRKQSITKAVRVQDREESFYQYGGFRIWLRTISRLADRPDTSG